MGAVVRHTGDDHWSTPMQHDDMLIEQYSQSQPLELGGPGTLPGVVLMIARHEKCTVARTQSGKGLGVGREVLHRTIHQIAGHRDEICIECIYRVYDRIDVSALDGGTNVDVADLHNRESVQRVWQIAQRNFNALDAGTATRVCKPDHGGEHGEPYHEHCRGGCEHPQGFC